MKEKEIKSTNVDAVEVKNEPKARNFKAIKFRSKSDEVWFNRVPAYQQALIFILRNNVEIRRFTALAIINYLTQKGEINGNKRYINFYWNKFQVKVDGMVREFAYTEPFFMNALVASFSSFAASAQSIINEFCNNALNKPLNNVVKQETINEIVATNEANTHVEIESEA